MLQTVDTTTRIREWILGNFPAAQEQGIGPGDSLFDTGIVDSLGVLEIVMFLETEFGVAALDDDMVPDHFESIEAIARFVGRKIAA